MCILLVYNVQLHYNAARCKTHKKKIAAKGANIKEHDMVLCNMKCYPVMCLYHIGHTHPHYK